MVEEFVVFAVRACTVGSDPKQDWFRSSWGVREGLRETSIRYTNVLIRR